MSTVANLLIGQDKKSYWVWVEGPTFSRTFHTKMFCSTKKPPKIAENKFYKSNFTTQLHSHYATQHCKNLVTLVWKWQKLLWDFVLKRFFRQPKISTHLLCGALHPWTPRMSVMSVIIVVVMPMAPVQIGEQENNRYVTNKELWFTHILWCCCCLSASGSKSLRSTSSTSSGRIGSSLESIIDQGSCFRFMFKSLAKAAQCFF